MSPADQFAGAVSCARTNPARGAVRARREINRRNMKAARPSVPRPIALRIRQWYRAIEQARDDRKISLGCDRYLKRIKGQRTVAHGGYADVRDDTMAGWLGRSRRTVLRYRAEAVKAGLLEDLGTKGLDHKPCMVRPLLSDGPVFTDSSVTLSVTKPAHEPTQSESTPPSPSETGFRVHAYKENGEAWKRYWTKRGERAPPIGREGYFIRPLPSHWPPEQEEVKRSAGVEVAISVPTRGGCRDACRQ